MISKNNFCISFFIIFTTLFSFSLNAQRYTYPFVWEDSATANSPSARDFAAMTFDQATGNIVLFGGFNGTTANAETWSYNASPTLPTWTQVTTVNAPSARYGATLEFDPHTGMDILFGGTNGTTVNAETWSFNGTTGTWTVVTPVVSPPARSNGSMVYDPCLGRIILFGGIGATQNFLNDTWAYNASTNTWTNLAPTTPPTAREGASMVFDPSSGTSILFGGNALTDFADTWVFDSHANTWTNVTPATSPPARTFATMKFNSAGGHVFLFGGLDSANTQLNDNWIYDSQSNTWTFLVPFSGAPPERTGGSMAFDPQKGQIILFGGQNTLSGYLRDTWKYFILETTLDWENLNPPNPPSIREFYSSVFDPCNGDFVIFGGVTGVNTVLQDTWGYKVKTNTWTNLTPAGISPPARYVASMAFDPCMGQAILFGGFNVNGQIIYNDTWSFDAKADTWTQLAPANAPSARSISNMTFDPNIGEIILFGGDTLGGNVNDTWAFNAQATPLPTWTQLAPTASPTARSGHEMTYDPNSGMIIMFGGTSPTNVYLNDTWAFNSKLTPPTWINLNPTNPPTVRAIGGFSFDDATGNILLFGGSNGGNVLGDTWQLNLTTNAWTQLTPAASPSARQGTEMQFDPASGRIILFGGSDGNTTLQDTWTLGVAYIPEIYSAATATFPTGVFSVFTIDTVGFPNASITEVGALPTGVTLVDNGNGTAVLLGTPAQGTEGTYPLTIFATNSAGTGTQAFSLIVTGIATSTALQVTPNPSLFGEAVLLTATVTPSTTGQVSFYDGATLLDTATLVAGSANFSTNAFLPGAHQITAVYNGNPTHIGSTSPIVTLEVETTSSTAITVTPNPAKIGEPVTVNVVITPPTATGTVTVYEDGNPIGTVPVVNGAATFTTNAIGAGTHTIYVVYSGDANNTPSISPSVTLVISNILPPGVLKAYQQANKFLTQTEYANIIVFAAPAGDVTSYRIYRDAALQDLIGEIPNAGSLVFEDHNRKKGRSYTYYIVSVSGAFVSAPTIVTIAPKK